MITLPRTAAEAVAATGEFRAGGTDLFERHRTGVSRGPVVDLHGVPGLDKIEWDGSGRAHIGALVTVAALASDEAVRRGYPGLAAAAGALATPQIRTVGTVGGNLLQRSRCWYYRHPATSCFKKGGDSCPARDGNHLYGVRFDLGPCVAPHPSTLGMTLLAYEAQAEIHGQPARAITELFGDGSDPTRDNLLAPGELLTGLVLPPPQPGELAGYTRATSRALAEWPLVEVVVRLVVDGTIRFARVAVGGVAPVPLRLTAVEDALVSRAAVDETFEDAASVATQGGAALPMTGYKIGLIRGTVLDTLQRACSGQS